MTAEDGAGLRVLVIGGTGFLGRHIVAELLRRGHEATVLSRTGAPEGSADRSMVVGDVARLSVDELAETLTGHDGLVFAAGVDADRPQPPPVIGYYRQGNVAPVERLMAAAHRAGCGRAVICGSYFTAIDRQRPGARLAETHPYIQGRAEQAAAALDAAGPDLSAAVLEIPFVFGATPGRRAAFTPLAPWLRSRVPLVAPPGGTAVAPVGAIAQAAAGALERRATGSFPVAEANLTWAEILLRLGAAAGRPEPVRVRRLPPAALTALIGLASLRFRASRKEPGLLPSGLVELLTSELYLDPDVCRDELGVVPLGLDEAFRDTVSPPAPSSPTP